MLFDYLLFEYKYIYYLPLNYLLRDRYKPEPLWLFIALDHWLKPCTFKQGVVNTSLFNGACMHERMYTQRAATNKWSKRVQVLNITVKRTVHIDITSRIRWSLLPLWLCSCLQILESIPWFVPNNCTQIYSLPKADSMFELPRLSVELLSLFRRYRMFWELSNGIPFFSRSSQPLGTAPPGFMVC